MGQTKQFYEVNKAFNGSSIGCLRAVSETHFYLKLYYMYFSRKGSPGKMQRSLRNKVNTVIH
jgi:hypothetical protein